MNIENTKTADLETAPSHCLRPLWRANMLLPIITLPSVRSEIIIVEKNEGLRSSMYTFDSKQSWLFELDSEESDSEVLLWEFDVETLVVGGL